ncbi:hypothetical protein GWC77_25950 [Paraburkholderia sp. NMBU_R16]|uniref:hypothetical protein n=1 Tax=Paraburkholderia sp. NMBU_R16 TaxID=2698676 RepID=UPI001565EE00|nr:hypothetical protein [Paraburkholderia sp. NMBU_R16]NRO99334.1 hypothetical protein [Paraburkholderia sp. NMBU_R16]
MSKDDIECSSDGRNSVGGNSPRGALPLLDRRRSSTAFMTSLPTGATVGTVSEIELQNMPAGHIARLSHKEMQAVLHSLDDLCGTLTHSLRSVGRIYARVKEELNKPDCPILPDTQIRSLDEIQYCIGMMRLQKRDLDQLREHLKKFVMHQADTAKNRTWGEWLRSDPVQKAIAVAEVAFAMVLKFGAWYGVEAILPGEADAFETTAKTAVLITQRLLLSLLLAGVGEYVPGTDGPRRWVNAGGDLKTIQGFGQAVDQGITLAGQFGTNSASGQAAPSPGQIAGFGLVGLGGVLQTGALNKPILSAIDYLRNGNDGPEGGLDLVDTEELRATQRKQAQGRSPQAEVSGRDLEEGRGPVTQGAGGKSDVSALIDDLLTRHVPTMRTQITRAFKTVSGVHKALASPAGSAHEAAEAAAMDALRDATGQALLRPVPPQDHEAQVAQFRRDLDSIRAAAFDVRDGLAPNDELRDKIEAVFRDAGKMEEAVTNASENLTPHDTAFLRGMIGLGSVGLLLTFIGPPTGNKWLSNVNNRAAIAGLTSSIGQNLANLGQFLGGAKPGDGRLMRFLKMGLDNENDNQVVKFAKDWGRNIRFLPIEFVPLTISTTLAEMGSKLKGQVPNAPLNAIPSVTTDRLMMEALRMALSNAFMVFRLGHKLEWHHYAGMASTFAGAATAVGTELRR